jgi:hypothetical protein
MAVLLQVRVSQNCLQATQLNLLQPNCTGFPAGIWTQQAGCQVLQSLNFVYTILSLGLELLLHSATFAA